MTPVPFINNYELRLTPSKILKTYGFVLQNFENKEPKNKVHYEIEVQYVTKKNQNFVFEINRKQVYINNLAPELMLEQLADMAGKVIYPIQIATNRFGQIDSIANYESIAQRWVAEKQNLLDYYQGAIAERIINNIEELLLNEDELKQSLYKNWFFSLYFSPLYLSYTHDLSKMVERNYPVFGNIPVKYKANHKVEKSCTDTNKIIINANGKTIDDRTIKEVLEGYNYPKAKMMNTDVDTIKSELEIQYKLHADDGSIFSVIATFDTPIDADQSKKTKIELYQL
jgi:hypothetical protein